MKESDKNIPVEVLDKQEEICKIPSPQKIRSSSRNYKLLGILLLINFQKWRKRIYEIIQEEISWKLIRVCPSSKVNIHIS